MATNILTEINADRKRGEGGERAPFRIRTDQRGVKAHGGEKKKKKKRMYRQRNDAGRRSP